MAQQRLDGRNILVVEDEPFIALDLTETLEAVGAQVTMARTLPEALTAVQDSGLSAAILDHAIGPDKSSQVCEKLDGREIPYVMYSGADQIDGPCGDAPLIQKPAPPDTLVNAVGLLFVDEPLK